MRLRQVALMAHKIAPVAGQLEYVFGLKVAFRDPGVAVFGLANVVMPAGGEFIEVLEPIREDASGARYLARRGGDAGYMVILQDADAMAHRTRLEAQGVRLIARSRDGRYRYTHFHPGDCAGVLMSIDSVEGDADWREPLSDWPPAGEQWRDFESEVTLGMTSVTIQHRDPKAAAERWSMLLERPVIADGDAWELALEGEAIRFVPPVDEDATGVVGIELVVDDVEAVMDRAAAIGVATKDGGVLIGGVTFTPVSGE
ncbi:MAG: VOC family protein [Proteobacteria bacterium]|nr:VOC family protein [Pseudomonadota bacterium]